MQLNYLIDQVQDLVSMTITDSSVSDEKVQALTQQIQKVVRDVEDDADPLMLSSPKQIQNLIDKIQSQKLSRSDSDYQDWIRRVFTAAEIINFGLFDEPENHEDGQDGEFAIKQIDDIYLHGTPTGGVWMATILFEAGDRRDVRVLQENDQIKPSLVFLIWQYWNSDRFSRCLKWSCWPQLDNSLEKALRLDTGPICFPLCQQTPDGCPFTGQASGCIFGNPEPPLKQRKL
jgi:hypothetical protein